MRFLASFLVLALAGCSSAPEQSAPPPPPAPVLVIVTPAAFIKPVEEYAEYRRSEMPTAVATLESLRRSFKGDDDAEIVKRYLFEEWRKGALKYALLVGDADVFPVRYMTLDRVTGPAFDVAFYPSDLYYADLTRAGGVFDDWNAEKEGVHAHYYGEVHGEKHKTPPVNFDDIDYRPEIAVGRWPVSTPAQVAALAAKTMAYERALDARSRRVGLVVAGGWVDARGAFDKVAKGLPAGWEAEKLFYRDGGGGPDAKRVAALARGEALFVVHAGHGSEAGWQDCLAIDALRQRGDPAKATILVSAGCSTAVMATLPPYEPYTDAFGAEHPGTNAGEVFSAEPPPPACLQPKHNATSLGKESLRLTGGAVAYFGCDTGSQPCALTLVGAFVEGLSAANAPRVGDMWRSAVAAYWERERLAEIVPSEEWYPPSVFFQGMKFVLLGDPSLRVVPVPR